MAAYFGGIFRKPALKFRNGTIDGKIVMITLMPTIHPRSFERKDGQGHDGKKYSHCTTDSDLKLDAVVYSGDVVVE